MSAVRSTSPDRAQPQSRGVEGPAASKGVRTGAGECTQYLGVKWSGRLGEWVVSVRLDSREAVNFGSRKSAEAAARLHDCGVLLLFGPNARTNFPMQMYGEEEVERVRQQLRPLLSSRDAMRRDLRRFSECDQNLTRANPSPIGPPAPPLSSLLMGQLGLEHAHEKENCPGGVFAGSGFKSNGGNFQQWSRWPGEGALREKRPGVLLTRGGVTSRKSWGQGGPITGAAPGREIGRRVASGTPKTFGADPVYPGWGIKKPARKARTRTCRRVPPPIPAAPLGSTKWQYRGISWNQALGLWTAYLYDPENKKTVYLGTRKSQQEAAALHDWGMLILQGPDAITNFPKCSSKPSLQELKQVKDRLVAARSVTEEVASERMSHMLPDDGACLSHDGGKWCNQEFPQEFPRRSAQGHTPQDSPSTKGFIGLGNTPHLLHRRFAEMPGHSIHGDHRTVSPPLFDAMDEEPCVINGPGWQRVDLANGHLKNSPPVLGPMVATGVNLIESGPLAGQYLIVVQVDGKDTTLPVGYAPTAMQAAQVHDMVVLALHGSQAVLNFPASSYQLRAFGSVLGALPHLFPPHTFWKGMATAGAAGVKNDINFPGIRPIAPCPGDFGLPISGFCPKYIYPHEPQSPGQESSHHGSKARKKAQTTSSTCLRSEEDISMHKPSALLTKRRNTEGNNKHDKWFESLLCTSKVGGGCTIRSIPNNGVPNERQNTPEDLLGGTGVVGNKFDHSSRNKSHGGDANTKPGDMNEEELRAAKTLTLLGSVGKMATRDGGSDASDARNALGHSVSSNGAAFQGVHVLQKDIYSASIDYNGQIIDIGLYDDPVQAARAHDMVAVGLMGPGACTNFPPSTFCSNEITGALRDLQLCTNQTRDNLVIESIENAEGESLGCPSSTPCRKALHPGGVTRKGRVVRKPKRFQQGLSQMQFWDCPVSRWVENIENTRRNPANGPKPLTDRVLPPVEARAF